MEVEVNRNKIDNIIFDLIKFRTGYETKRKEQYEFDTPAEYMSDNSIPKDIEIIERFITVSIDNNNIVIDGVDGYKKRIKSKFNVNNTILININIAKVAYLLACITELNSKKVSVGIDIDNEIIYVKGTYLVKTMNCETYEVLECTSLRTITIPIQIWKFKEDTIKIE